MANDNAVGKGAIFRNRTANPHPKAPGYRGSATIQCPHCGETHKVSISAWVYTAGEHAARPGEKYFSLNLQKYNEPQAPATPADADEPF